MAVIRVASGQENLLSTFTDCILPFEPTSPSQGMVNITTDTGCAGTGRREQETQWPPGLRDKQDFLHLSTKIFLEFLILYIISKELSQEGRKRAGMCAANEA
ncbi:hypothetical protein P7K49_012026, partial [Saguinus oedipus]